MLFILFIFSQLLGDLLYCIHNKGAVQKELQHYIFYYNNDIYLCRVCNWILNELLIIIIYMLLQINCHYVICPRNIKL